MNRAPAVSLAPTGPGLGGDEGELAAGPVGARQAEEAGAAASPTLAVHRSRVGLGVRQIGRVG
ncbi:hypothetical protein UK82_28825 [Frankia sp. ACN1ag]|nr:hypothetical protein UK82_28825 [Frankia sp. ACN1ag]